jgi:hypothetical protein
VSEAVSSPTIKVAWYPHFGAEPELHEYTFDQFEENLQHVLPKAVVPFAPEDPAAPDDAEIQAAKRALPFFVPGDVHGRECKGAHFLSLDLDEGDVTKDLDMQSRLGIRGFAFASSSDGMEGRGTRARSVVALDREVSPQEYELLQDVFRLHILKSASKKARDNGRANFFGRLQGAPERWFKHFDGQPLPVDAFIQRFGSSVPASDNLNLNAARLKDKRQPQDLTKGSGRSARLLSLAGRLRHFGFEEHQILGAVRAENKLFADPEPDEECEHIAESVMRYEPGVPVPPPQKQLDPSLPGRVIAGVNVLADEDLDAEDNGDVKHTIPSLNLSPGRPHILLGPPNGGKSTAAMGLLLSLASQEMIWGTLTPAPEKLNCLYVNYDEGSRNFKRRYRSMKKGMRLQRVDGVNYADGLMTLNTFEGMQQLESLISELKPSVLFIDSLESCNPGVKENDTTAAAPLRWLCRVSENYSVVVIMIHHSTKENPDVLRGTSAIPASTGEVFSFAQREGLGYSVKHVQARDVVLWEGNAYQMVRNVDAVPFQADGHTPDLNAIVGSKLTLRLPALNMKQEEVLTERVRAFTKRELELKTRVLSTLKTMRNEGANQVSAAAVGKVVGLPEKEAARILNVLSLEGGAYNMGCKTHPNWMVGGRPVEDKVDIRKDYA